MREEIYCELCSRTGHASWEDGRGGNDGGGEVADVLLGSGFEYSYATH